jgi:RimJ/RimL family protein N-acetyltransferase
MMFHQNQHPAVALRTVKQSDLSIFYEQQLDPEATSMADFPSRNRDAFIHHWVQILDDKKNLLQTILYEGQVAGNIVSFDWDHKREVGYWLGKEFWGRGIATNALSEFLKLETTRPLYAYVVQHNIGSHCVLEKCGFMICGEVTEISQLRLEDVVMDVLKLD